MGRELRFAIPGDLDAKTGGYIYDRKLIAGLERLDWRVEHLAWPASFPFPTTEDRAEVARNLSACPDGSLVIVDGLAFGALPEIAEAESRRLRLVALVHHPLALETGLSERDSRRLRGSERRALAAARAVIVTSATTATILTADYGVAPALITVAKPGCDPAPSPARRREPTDGGPRLLSVGSIIPRKGYDLLIEALARLAHLPWTLAIAGSIDRAPQAAAALKRQIEASGLGDRVRLLGEVSDTASLYETAHAFVLASRYEGYGMVFAEALRHGLPIIGTRIDAVAEIVPATAGILVPIDDAATLASALEAIITDPARRASLTEGARSASKALPSWEETARLVVSALLSV